MHVINGLAASLSSLNISAPSPPESGAVLFQGILCRMTCVMVQVASLDTPRRLAAAAAGTRTDSGWEQHRKKPYKAPSGPVSALYSQLWHLLGGLWLQPSSFHKVPGVVFPAVTQSWVKPPALQGLGLLHMKGCMVPEAEGRTQAADQPHGAV